MKKFLAGIAAAAIITVPMTSFALEAMSKGALKKATAQAGVSIAIDNVVIYMSSQPTTTYWDNDGTSKATGTVGTVNRAGIEISYDDAAQKLITIGAILDGSVYGASVLGATFETAGIGIADSSTLTQKIDPTTGSPVGDTAVMTPSNGNFTHGISPLTIDVGTCQALTQGYIYNSQYNSGTQIDAATSATAMGGNANIAGVVIGLPTVEIKTYYTDEIKYIKLSSAAATATGGAANAGKEFISIEKSGDSTMAILGGRLEIAPH